MAIDNPGPPAPSRLKLVGAGLGVLSALLGSLAFGLAGPIGAVGAVLVAGIAGALLLALAAGVVAPASAASAQGPAAPIEAPAEIPVDRIDSLTGLANENGLRAWFKERIPRLAEDGMGIVVLSADLEGFPILAAKGQAVADKVLIEVAKRVAVFAGIDGIAARTGGAEFASVAAVVPQHSEDVAAEYAAKLAEMLQRPVELTEGVIWIGGNVGAAAGPAAEGEGVLVRARAALERAKPLGRGQYVVDRR